MNEGRKNQSRQRSHHEVVFNPGGVRVRLRTDESFLQGAQRAKIPLPSVCGGKGSCKKCAVKVLEGQIAYRELSGKKSQSSDESLTGLILACQASPLTDCAIELSSQSMATTLRYEVVGKNVEVSPESRIKSIRVELEAPTLSDSEGDADRLLVAINENPRTSCHRVDITVLRSLSHTLRKNQWDVEAIVRDDELVGLLAPEEKILGLAIDLGTTNIGIHLVDLKTGQTLAHQGLANPQGIKGADIITRAAYARSEPEGLNELSRLVCEGINEITSLLCDQLHLKSYQIFDVVIAGNTVMHHLLLQLPLDFLTSAPFISGISDAQDFKAREVGIDVASGAYVHMMPNIAAFVGGDHVALLLAASHTLDFRAQTLLLDIGTNTEISLVNDKGISSVSCPSGPALEGGDISCGVRACEGAIESLKIVGHDVKIVTIGSKNPVGLCGSGVLETVAELLRAGLLEKSGRFISDHPLLERGENQQQFVICSGQGQDEGAIVFTQKDVRAVQLAKSAIRSGINQLIKNEGLRAADITKVVVAGAFGSFIDLGAAIDMGLLPDLPLKRFEQVGNAALDGAKLALCSMSERERAKVLARQIRYIEIATNRDFQSEFIKNTRF